MRMQVWSEKIAVDGKFSYKHVGVKVEKIQQMATISYDHVGVKVENITADDNYFI